MHLGYNSTAYFSKDVNNNNEICKYIYFAYVIFHLQLNRSKLVWGFSDRFWNRYISNSIMIAPWKFPELNFILFMYPWQTEFHEIRKIVGILSFIFHPRIFLICYFLTMKKEQYLLHIHNQPIYSCVLHI